MSTWTRREFLGRAGAAAGLAVGAVGLDELLAACGGTSAGSPNGVPSGTLEIFSWWTSGGEKDGLDELFKIYEGKYSRVTIKNSAVAGGAGTDAKAVLATRMEGGKPPDSFQVHAGQELISTWVKAGKMEPITDIWQAQGWDSIMPQGLKDIVSSKGEVWSVPVDIHRGNLIWYSAKALSSAGIQPPTTFQQLFQAMDALKGKGMQAPLALGSKGNWQVAMWLENGVLGLGGPAYYKQLFMGKGNFEDATVKQVLTNMKQMLEYVNSDHPTIDWDEASKRLISGSSAFTIMGDWAKGYFTANSWVTGTDFQVVTWPGTATSYMVICDTFGIPKGAPNHSAAVSWVETAGSEAGQAAFNPKKGSIPARTDVPKDLFDSISQQFIDDFKSSSLVPSSAHGSATPEAFSSAVNDELGQFVQARDVNATAANLQKLSGQYLAAS